MTTKKKTPTAVETAQQSLAEVQTTISSLHEEIAKLEQEHQQIEGDCRTDR